jgi:hypothetical protein
MLRISNRLALPLAFVALILLAGCGLPNIARYPELVPGKSTIADAVAVRGPPKGETILGDGGEIVSWVDLDNLRVTTVGLIFDRQGHFVRVGTVVYR